MVKCQASLTAAMTETIYNEKITLYLYWTFPTVSTNLQQWWCYVSGFLNWYLEQSEIIYYAENTLLSCQEFQTVSTYLPQWWCYVSGFLNCGYDRDNIFWREHSLLTLKSSTHLSLSTRMVMLCVRLHKLRPRTETIYSEDNILYQHWKVLPVSLYPPQWWCYVSGFINCGYEQRQYILKRTLCINTGKFQPSPSIHYNGDDMC